MKEIDYPKCKTCDHWLEPNSDPPVCCHPFFASIYEESFIVIPEDFGCVGHSDFNKEVTTNEKE